MILHGSHAHTVKCISPAGSGRSRDVLHVNIPVAQTDKTAQEVFKGINRSTRKPLGAESPTEAFACPSFAWLVTVQEELSEAALCAAEDLRVS